MNVLENLERKFEKKKITSRENVKIQNCFYIRACFFGTRLNCLPLFFCVRASRHFDNTNTHTHTHTHTLYNTPHKTMAAVQQRRSPTSTARLAPEDELKQLDCGSLRVGRIIYVNRRRAKVTAVDLPLVFYSFDGDDLEHHRSIAAAPHEFCMSKNEPDLPSDSDSESASDTATEEADERHDLVDDDNSDDDDDEPQATVEPAPSAPLAAANLFSALSMRYVCV
jgi:hypothetical protein